MIGGADPIFTTTYSRNVCQPINRIGQTPFSLQGAIGKEAGWIIIQMHLNKMGGGCTSAHLLHECTYKICRGYTKGYCPKTGIRKTVLSGRPQNRIYGYHNNLLTFFAKLSTI